MASLWDGHLKIPLAKHTHVLRTYQHSTKIVIMGDLNSDLSLKRQEGVESHLGRRLTRILNTYGLKCVIKEPTRISDKAQTLIDLIIVSHAGSITTAGEIGRASCRERV